MEQLFDPWLIVYTVIGLVPNLLLMLWALARLSRDVRLLFVKISMLESELRLVDQSINDVAGGRRAGALDAVDPPSSAPVDPAAGGKMGGGFW